MATPINILIVEDSPDDAELALHELRRAGFDPKWKRVETETDFLAEINKLPDIILSDYTMPKFSGLRAAELLRKSGLDIPFILISGTVGEEVAVEAMRHGATDYLLKDRIARLGPAAKRALEEKQLRVEREGAATELEQMHRRHELILNSVADGIHGIDLQGNITFENHTAAKIFGWNINEMVGKPAHSLMHHSHADGSPYPVEQCPIYSTLHDGVTRRVDSEVFWRKDGTSFLAEYITAPNRDKSGAIIGTVVVFRDITERKQAEEKLLQSERDLAEGQRVAKIGSWHYDLTTQKVRWSDELCRIFGIEKARFDGRYETFLNCVLPEDRPAVLRVNAEAKADGTNFELEYRAQTPAGDLKTIREIGYAIKDAEGRVVRLFGTAQDVTERKQAEQSLLESEEKFRQIAENINEVFWITNPTKHQMLYISPAYEIVWGRTRESLYQAPQTWLDAIHPEDRQRILDAATTKQERGEYDETYRIVRPDGSVRWIHDCAFPVRNPAGQAYRIVGVAEDITEHRTLEEQFRQAQKMEAFGQMAGGVAHDFNNMLAVILMHSSLLQTDEGLSPAHLETAREIGKAAQRAADLTRQLLIFSRKKMLQLRDVDLNKSINEVTKMLRRTIGEDVDLQFRFSMQPIFIHADATMVDQVLMNLTVNARDAMPKGGQLVIETSAVDFDEITAPQTSHARPGSFACLSVSDTGSGIPPEILPRIFEPFFTTKEAGKGTGLGLATVFGIVEHHTGWINISSEVGRGTTFRIYLPRLATVPSEQTSQQSAQAGLTAKRGGNETILLVEDEVSVRVSIRLSLAHLGYRVLEAINGAEALKIWKQHRKEIQLLLTDLVMPGGMTGKDVAEQLSKENPKLKVIYISGYTAGIAAEGLSIEEGVNFLNKPFTAHKLTQTVRNCLDNI